MSAARVVGIEREFSVHDADGPVDVRQVWPLLALGAALDPGDPLARRAAWGGLVTADGREAEAATPPIALGAGCTSTALALAAAGRRQLADRLAQHPPGHHLVGYSTHLSVEVSERRVCRVARLVAEVLALPLMLALDREGSPGLLVRPRHGRLEIGGEFAAGTSLRSALVMAIGMTLLAERTLRRPWERRHLPRPRVAVAPAVERHGWYVDRRAFGPDLYLQGRATTIAVHRPGRRGTTNITAQDVLTTAWGLARPLVAARLAPDEVALGDALVDGRSPLPLHHPVDDDGPVAAPPARDYGPRRRPSCEVTIEAATWHRAQVRVMGPRRTRWLTLPGRELDGWLDDMDAGHLDPWLHRVVAAPTSRGRRAAGPG